MLPDSVNEIWFLLEGRICVKLQKLETFSYLHPLIKLHCDPRCTSHCLSVVCSPLHWRTSYGQFFIPAEINFSGLSLSLSLSVCSEEEDNKSDKFSFCVQGLRGLLKRSENTNFIFVEVRQWCILLQCQRLWPLSSSDVRVWAAALFSCDVRILLKS